MIYLQNYKIQKLKIVKYYKAVTLVELLLVIAIIGIMSAVGFASLSSGKTSTKLQAAQREVASTIKLAQSYALQGRVANGSTPCGFGFRFDHTDTTNKNAYQIFYNSQANCDDYNLSNTNRHYIPGTSQVFQDLTLNDGVMLESPDIYAGNPNTTEIYFTIPGGNIYGQDGNPYPGETLVFELSDKTKNILIDSGGSITEQ